MVDVEWARLPERFPTIELDCYVIMPNHLHGILVIHNSLPEDPLQAQKRAPATAMPQDDQGAHTAGETLGEMISTFKSLSTREYIRCARERGWPRFERQVWHRNYYEHIIRNECELGVVREYIVNNPLRWALDRENLARLAGR